MKTDSTIHLAIAFDENYVTLCYVLLTSIFENNKSVKVVIHTIATGVNETDRAEIKEFVNKNGNEIYYYDIDSNNLQGLIFSRNSHLTPAAYYRLFFPAIVPAEVKKLLYMDVDIVVVGSLVDLYNTDMGSYAVGAAIDSNTKKRPDLGIYEPKSYFNSGVLLMNTDEWRKQKVTENAFEFMAKHPEKIKMEDQDALNGSLVNKWYKLDPKYNVTLFDIPENLKRSEYNSFIADKVIIHYTKGKHKPWMILNKNRLRFLYHLYLKKSPAKYKKKYVDFKLKPVILYRFLKIRAGEALIPYPKIYKIAKKVKLV